MDGKIWKSTIVLFLQMTKIKISEKAEQKVEQLSIQDAIFKVSFENIQFNNSSIVCTYMQIALHINSHPPEIQ